MTHDELVARAVKWLRNPSKGRSACGVVVPELCSYGNEEPDAFGWNTAGSYLIECKVSRSDFFADRHKPRHRTGRPGPGAYCYYMTPPDLVTPDEVPDGWGLLYCHPKRVTLERAPEYQRERCLRSEVGMMYSLLRRVEIRGNLTACLAPKWGGDSTLSPAPEGLHGDD